MGTNKAAGEKTEDWKKQASGDERKMKWNRKLKMGTKNGSNGARTHDLSRVRRTLIPAELCFHVCIYQFHTNSSIPQLFDMSSSNEKYFSAYDKI